MKINSFILEADPDDDDNHFDGIEIDENDPEYIAMMQQFDEDNRIYQFICLRLYAQRIALAIYHHRPEFPMVYPDSEWVWQWDIRAVISGYSVWN